MSSKCTYSEALFEKDKTISISCLSHKLENTNRFERFSFAFFVRPYTELSLIWPSSPNFNSLQVPFSRTINWKISSTFVPFGCFCYFIAHIVFIDWWWNILGNFYLLVEYCQTGKPTNEFRMILENIWRMTHFGNAKNSRWGFARIIDTWRYSSWTLWNSDKVEWLWNMKIMFFGLKIFKWRHRFCASLLESLRLIYWGSGRGWPQQEWNQSHKENYIFNSGVGRGLRRVY